MTSPEFCMVGVLGSKKSQMKLIRRRGSGREGEKWGGKPLVSSVIIIS